MRAIMRAAAAALLVTTLAAVPASARTGFRTTPTDAEDPVQLHMRLGFSGPLGIDVECDVTLWMDLHERITKQVGAWFGESTIRIETGYCDEGNMGLLVGGQRVVGPWPFFDNTYRTFTGVLPDIASLTLVLNDVAFWIEVGGVTCLTAGAVDIDVTAYSGMTWVGAIVRAANVPLAGGIPCLFATGTLDAEGTYSRAVLVELF